MHKYRSNGPNKLNLWSFYDLTFSLTLTFNLTEQIFQMALLLFKENNSAKLFRNPCQNVQVMVRGNSIYDHLINWPSSVTLTFNLHEQMFQMALQLVAEKNSAKLFRNPWMNVQVMACISSILIISSFDLQVWPWPSTYLNKGIGTSTLQRKQPCHNYLEIHA